MARTERAYGRFRYTVEIDGIQVANFSEVTGFDANIDVMEYREGDMVTTPMKEPGLKKYGNISLRRGVGDGKAMWDWIYEGIDDATEVHRTTITITLLDQTGTAVASWQVINAWPMKYTAPDLSATASEIAIESLEVVHEGMTRVS